ncbi:hypothetical protein XELAEV_18036129mg [Xenopus laevis]|uniref:Uncharacterized protein n=1 Tax=Xenopus laevis TaxID=8355 RepID=A0A974CGV6_XENLA|nr:hypothetical protein XELAEV_18036129mg [Xenopus laevis]
MCNSYCRHLHRYTYTRVATHFLDCTNGNLDHFSIQGIQRLIPDKREGDQIKKLLYLEAKWIFVLATRSPMGLNSEYDVSCYF